ncbi:MAG: hypothetical protein LBJ72_12920 [Dysgonamonadaceae bacterium]|jgi:hypothetical protein|nr:hypothetical protein [Dysgonamonadaceae bacterium]
MDGKNILKIKNIILGLALLSTVSLSGQNALQEPNVRVRAIASDPGTIRLRWAPANPGAWSDGIKYGYTIERYTLIKDSIYQPQPDKAILKQSLKPVPLSGWEKPSEESDYAAVIAQAIYGDDFELSNTSSTVGQIINQSNELNQRFATSIFMAEYDFKAAQLAGWAYIDPSTDEKNQYLYRVILERPRKQPGDTAVVFLGYKDRQELPEPLELNAIWGNEHVMLFWNYELLSSVYHSYHVERKSSADHSFIRITTLPVTAMGENKQLIFYTDSLPDNETTFSYRVIGITGFGEEGVPSDTISGTGIKTVSCVPNIYAGSFIAKNQAHLFWQFDCPEPGLIEKLIVKRSSTVDGDYEILKDNISVEARNTDLEIHTDVNYVKLFAVNKNGVETASFPFSLNQVDSIPPAVPLGLEVNVDSTAVAHLRWTANTESDLRGYRILRAFTPDGEKSSITSGFLPDNQYTDTLSLEMGNEKVYYALTAVDMHYNESQACETVEAVKPNNVTPPAPRFTGYEVKGDGKVVLSWMTDDSRQDIDYRLVRISSDGKRDTVFNGNEKIRTFTDETDRSGTYEYTVIAKNKTNRKETVSPQPISVSVHVTGSGKTVSGFYAFVDTEARYIELSWRKHPEATSYMLYKKAGDKPVVFWKEVSASVNRLTDEVVFPDTDYEYTIVYSPQSGGTSKAKTIKVHY